MHLLVLSAFRPDGFRIRRLRLPVSMHLLVLSAFRLEEALAAKDAENVAVSMHLLVLSAFRPHPMVPLQSLAPYVSMHLLVLSAFRLGARGTQIIRC